MLYVYDRKTSDSLGEFATRAQMKKFLRSNNIRKVDAVVKHVEVEAEVEAEVEEIEVESFFDVDE